MNNMDTRKFHKGYFFTLLFLAGAGTLYVISPFISALIVAAVLAGMFSGLYEQLLKKTNSTLLSSTLVTFLVIFIIVLPILGVSLLVSAEISTAFRYVGENPEFVQEVTVATQNFLADVPFLNMVDVRALVGQQEVLNNLQGASSLLLKFFQSAYNGVSAFIFWVFVMLFAFFFFLIDGKKILEVILRLSPLRDSQERVLIERFRAIGRSMLRGTLIIGIVQGTLGGFLFLFVGIPSPITWAVVMIILSTIPVLGAGIVWVPAGIILLLTGQTINGLIVLLFGVGVISTIDNLMRPQLVGKEAKIHELWVFLSTLGGIIMFGIVGFLIGPIILALFLALLKIYETEFDGHLTAYNESLRSDTSTTLTTSSVEEIRSSNLTKTSDAPEVPRT